MSDIKACYVLIFGNIANYFSKDVISSDEGYTIEEINPDLVMDFTDMKFPDECFNFVVFDPPHLINCGKNSWLAKKYGKLDKDTWRETLSKGLSECLRVVKPGCVVAMKWSERDIKTTELLKTLPQKPAFGDKSGMTRWLFFVKGVEDA